ncbi:type VI secretion system baseplate subunit TssF [Cocleimonas flava]|uniref:Type VI secretion system protein ImpG n=1 Tax=Cocleimonas flava TaxID=634765 RepID=A0A4R1F4J4_9GAMM|nr:type VI secretion system baseplate subunit TssF [Cocleimonas flava]TCJ87494.1 type VI secretion system protein ImpG [Cocleimonas flava]
MHPEMLKYYEKELQFVRGMGKEFAERYPGVAERLDLGGFECADPYVERLLEGFAFLSARIQLKLDAEFPKFTQNLLDMVYPHYLAPTPSMAIMSFEPDLDGGVTEDGFSIPRGTRLRSSLSEGMRTRCDYRTSQDVNLWPLSIEDVKYLRAGEAEIYNRSSTPVKSGIQVQLKVSPGIEFKSLSLNNLEFYLDGGGETPHRIYELLLAHCASIVIQPVEKNGKKPSWQMELPANSLSEMGFDQDQALLPYTDVSFQGYRYLQEYFAFPQRFLFVQLSGLKNVIPRCESESLEIIFLFKEKNDLLKGALGKDNLSLNCTPAINLFPKRADRIHLSHRSSEHQVIIDRTNPLDYEVFSITGVNGFDSSLQDKQTFSPFYASNNYDSKRGQAYYTISRKPRLQSTTNRSDKDYVGTEIFLSLVDSSETPYDEDLKQLGVSALCTNRDLPLHITSRGGKTLFTMEDSAPVLQIRSLAGPTKPKPPNVEGENAWRLISHLSLNYLSLMDKDEKEGAVALRELLTLYGDMHRSETMKQINGVLSVTSNPAVRRIPGAGPITFGRGVEISVNCKESAFDGMGVYLLGSILEHFFAKYVSLNSFTQTNLNTVERGAIKQWSVRTGTRATL